MNSTPKRAQCHYTPTVRKIKQSQQKKNTERLVYRLRDMRVCIEHEVEGYTRHRIS